MFNRDEAMTLHVNGSQALLQDDVTDQRLIVPICRFHFDKSNLTEDWAKTFDLDANRPANFSTH